VNNKAQNIENSERHLATRPWVSASSYF